MIRWVGGIRRLPDDFILCDPSYSIKRSSLSFFFSENRKTALRAEFDELVAKIILSVPLKPVPSPPCCAGPGLEVIANGVLARRIPLAIRPAFPPSSSHEKFPAPAHHSHCPDRGLRRWWGAVLPREDFGDDPRRRHPATILAGKLNPAHMSRP